MSLAESLIAQFRSSRDLVTPNLTTRLRVRKSAEPAIGVAMLALLWVPPLQAQSQDKDQPPAASSAGGMSNPSTDNQDKSGNPAQKDTSQKDEPPQNRVRAEQAKGNQDKGDTKEKELTPEEKINRRFPQPVRVGVLIGKPVLDGDDQTLGYVHDVVRAPDGKISLIVDYSAWFGWRTSRCRADRGGCVDRKKHCGARHAARGVRQGSDLDKQRRKADSPRRDDPHRRRATITRAASSRLPITRKCQNGSTAPWPNRSRSESACNAYTRRVINCGAAGFQRHNSSANRLE